MQNGIEVCFPQKIIPHTLSRCALSYQARSRRFLFIAEHDKYGRASIAGTGHKIVQPGYCTQCRAWLGTPPSPCASNDIDDEFFNWQMWAVNVVAELLQASNLQGPLAWERFGLGLIPCIEAAGGTRRLARLAGIGHDRLCQWINNKRVPSFKSVLECCYTLGISPLQAMASDPAALKEILGEK